MSPKSKTRRTGVVLNGNGNGNGNGDPHRPSSSQWRCRPSHFFKIILSSSKQDMKLRLPEKFVKEFGDELSTVAVLTVPNGCFRQVGLERAYKKIWFSDGLRDFLEFLSVQQGYLLVFKYKGNSSFHVLIFDMTATEIDYPSNGDKINGKDLKLDDQVDTTEFDGVKESRKGNETEVDTSIEDELPAKHGEDVEMYAALPRGRNVISRERELEIQAATMFETINPYFFRILRPYNLSNSLLVNCLRNFAGTILKG